MPPLAIMPGARAASRPARARQRSAIAGTHWITRRREVEQRVAQRRVGGRAPKRSSTARATPPSARLAREPGDVGVAVAPGAVGASRTPRCARPRAACAAPSRRDRRSRVHAQLVAGARDARAASASAGARARSGRPRAGAPARGRRRGRGDAVDREAALEHALAAGARRRAPWRARSSVERELRGASRRSCASVSTCEQPSGPPIAAPSRVAKRAVERRARQRLDARHRIAAALAARVRRRPRTRRSAARRGSPRARRGSASISASHAHVVDHAGGLEVARHRHEAALAQVERSRRARASASARGCSTRTASVRVCAGPPRASSSMARAVWPRAGRPQDGFTRARAICFGLAPAPRCWNW